MTSSNKLLRELLFWICKRNNSLLIGQCPGHVTRFLKSFAYQIFFAKNKPKHDFSDRLKSQNSEFLVNSQLTFMKIKHNLLIVLSKIISSHFSLVNSHARMALNIIFSEGKPHSILHFSLEIYCKGSFLYTTTYWIKCWK